MTAHSTMPRSGRHEPDRPESGAYEDSPTEPRRPARDSHGPGNGAPANNAPSNRGPVRSGAGNGGGVRVVESVPYEAGYDVAGFEVEPDGVAQEFTIRSSQKVHGGLAVGAALVAIGFAASASTTPTGVLRWIGAAAFAVLAVICARALTVGDMLVADQVGIRLRIRDEWIGTRWEDIEEVTVLRRRHPLDDGRIAVHLVDPGPVLSTMSAATRKTTDANRRLTGSSLAVPFGLTARPSNGEVVQALHMLADARCPVREQL